MSAGIVSACLPTLGPILFLVGRKVGMTRSLLSAGGSGGGATKASSSKNTVSKSSRSALDRADPDLSSGPSKKDSAGIFYRLRDDNISGETATNVAVDAQLRPKHGYVYAVTSQPRKGDGESLSGDEIPLHGIRVQTDFKRSV